eukprot:2503826-Pyramimonas_sp.AAC.1
MTDTVKNLTTLKAGSRDKSMRVLGEKLATFCGRVADQDCWHDWGPTRECQCLVARRGIGAL